MLGILILAVIIVAIIITVVVMTSGGLSAPEQAVLDFYNAMKSKNVMAYLKRIDTGMYKDALAGTYQPDAYSIGIEYDSYTVENLKTQLVSQSGDTAQVRVVSGTFEGFYDDGSNSGGVDFSRYPRDVTLKKDEGTWVVDNYNLVKLPYPLPEVTPDASEFPEVPGS
jgi:hypothetical protein